MQYITTLKGDRYINWDNVLIKKFNLTLAKADANFK